jgi:hypothetical protein
VALEHLPPHRLLFAPVEVDEPGEELVEAGLLRFALGAVGGAREEAAGE